MLTPKLDLKSRTGVIGMFLPSSNGLFRYPRTGSGVHQYRPDTHLRRFLCPFDVGKNLSEDRKTDLFALLTKSLSKGVPTPLLLKTEFTEN